MSVVTETNRTAELSTDGVETDFDFGMLIHQNDWLEVYYKVTGGAYGLLTLNTDYTVSFNELGGTITTIGGSSPFATGSLLIIRRPPFTELSNWLYLDNHSEFQHQNDFDQRAAVDIYMLELLERAPKFDITSSTKGITFPEPVANEIIGWNGAGDDLENKTPDSIGLSLAFDDLTDVDVDAPTDKDLVAFDSGSGVWKNITTITITSLKIGNWTLIQATNADVISGDAHVAGNLLMVHDTSGTKREIGF